MKHYYYSDGLRTHGPLSLEALRAEEIYRDTPVRSEDMEKWLPAEQFSELEGCFSEKKYAVNKQMQHIPKTWLAESILVTVFCCLPFGIAGIVNAARVESRYSCGDYEGAMRSSREAGKWTKIGFWLAVAGFVIYLSFLAVAFALDFF